MSGPRKNGPRKSRPAGPTTTTYGLSEKPTVNPAPEPKDRFDLLLDVFNSQLKTLELMREDTRWTRDAVEEFMKYAFDVALQTRKTKTRKAKK